MVLFDSQRMFSVCLNRCNISPVVVVLLPRAQENFCHLRITRYPMLRITHTKHNPKNMKHLLCVVGCDTYEGSHDCKSMRPCSREVRRFIDKKNESRIIPLGMRGAHRPCLGVTAMGRTYRIG